MVYSVALEVAIDSNLPEDRSGTVEIPEIQAQRLAQSSMAFTPEVWNGVRRRLQHELPTFSYDAWLAPLIPRLDERRLLLLCPTAFHRERVRNHFLPLITECLRAEAGAGVLVELGVAPAGSSSPRAGGKGQDTNGAPSGAADRATARAGEDGRPDGRCGRQHTRRSSRSIPRARRPLSSPSPETVSRPHRPIDHYTFDNFVVGPCNALAREASFAIARDQQQSLNQLYLNSGPGMGKTHLSRAVAAEAAHPYGDRVRYIAAETFTNEFLAALRSKKTGEFKRRYRSRCHLLVMEDIQFLQSKSATQLEFFHTVQHVLDAGGRVLMTGDRAPRELTDLHERLRSQLAGGFVAELEPPDAQVRRAILRSKAAHGGVRLPPDCLDLLVESVEGSVRELESVLIQLVTTASLLKRSIDIALTHSAIAKKLAPARNESQRLGVGAVVRAVAGFFQTTPEKLASRSRRRDVLLPRQLAMYLCRRYTDASVAEIGQALGRDHPSVRNAILKIERGILERPPLRYQIEALSERLDQLVKGARA